jgi:thioredoxin 1
MHSWLLNNWKSLSAIGLLVSAAGYSLGRPWAGCNLPAAASIKSNTDATTDGEEAASARVDLRGVEHANEATFTQQVLQSNVPVLVDFYADWCGPCKMLAPTLDELARETTGARIVKVNVDQNPQLAAQYGISSIPSLLVFKNGEIAGQHTGLASKSRLKAMLN